MDYGQVHVLWSQLKRFCFDHSIPIPAPLFHKAETQLSQQQHKNNNNWNLLHRQICEWIESHAIYE